MPPLVSGTLTGQVTDIFHNPGISTPCAMVKLQNGETFCVPACDGLRVGQTISVGPGAPVQPGNIVPLGNVPEGSKVYMIEAQPGDGGKFVRASGTYGIVVGREGRETIVQLPSGKTRRFLSECRAIVGIVAGGGRVDKPFVKAGKKYHHMRAKAKPYPRTRGVAMNVVDHPFGGGRRQHCGRPRCVSRNAPPGQKVGLIAARRTGIKKV